MNSMKTAEQWFEIITGLKALSEPEKGLIQEHCTICKQVMKRGRCITSECKYFQK